MDNGIWLARIDSPKGLRQQSQYNKPMLSWHKTKQTQSKPPVAVCYRLLVPLHSHREWAHRVSGNVNVFTNI